MEESLRFDKTSKFKELIPLTNKSRPETRSKAGVKAHHIELLERSCRKDNMHAKYECSTISSSEDMAKVAV